MLKSLVLPPVEFWRGTRPKKAANSLPFLKFEATPATVSRIVAVMMPIPGTCMSCWQASFSLATVLSSLSCSSIWLSKKHMDSYSEAILRRIRPERAFSSSAIIKGSWFRIALIPWRMMMPYSASNPLA